MAIDVRQSATINLECNTANNTANGINYWGMCDGAENKGNSLKGNQVGLQLGLPPNEGNVFLGAQTHYGNVWNGDFDIAGAKHLGNEPVVNQSRFFVDNEENSNFLPSSIDAVGNWFITEPDPAPSYYCRASNACGNLIPRSPKNGSLYNDLSKGSLKTDGFDASLNWTGQSHLYKRLMEETSIDNAVFINAYPDFVQEHEQSAIGEWYAIQEELSDIYQPNLNDGASAIAQETSYTLMDELTNAATDGIDKEKHNAFVEQANLVASTYQENKAAQ